MATLGRRTKRSTLLRTSVTWVLTWGYGLGRGLYMHSWADLATLRCGPIHHSCPGCSVIVIPQGVLMSSQNHAVYPSLAGTMLQPFPPLGMRFLGKFWFSHDWQRGTQVSFKLQKGSMLQLRAATASEPILLISERALALRGTLEIWWSGYTQDAFQGACCSHCSSDESCD